MVHLCVVCFLCIAASQVVDEVDNDSTIGYYSLDGSGNNLLHPTRGQTDTPYMAPAQRSYSDGISQIHPGLPGAREVSNVLAKIDHSKGGLADKSTTTLAFAQFMTIDLCKTAKNSSEPVPIPVPKCDDRFDVSCSGSQTLSFTRAAHFVAENGARQIPNGATHFLDASWLYTSDAEREYVGGRIRLPNNVFPCRDVSTAPLGYRGCPLSKLDNRVHSNPPLFAMALIFTREHNRICQEIALSNPGRSPTIDDEFLFQEARMRVIALVQKIAAEEYLPMLLGSTLRDYRQYNAKIDPSISLLFAAGAWRYAHSGLPSTYYFGNRSFALRDIVFNTCLPRNQIDEVIQGMIQTPIEGIDGRFATDMRDFLRLSATADPVGAHDILAINIQRGRDLGLPYFNDVRASFGLSRIASFEELVGGRVSNAGPNLSALSELYQHNIDRLDFYVGGVLEASEAEVHGSGSRELGETFVHVIRDQFQRLRRGDRLWYEWQPKLAAFVANRGLKNVIEENSGVGDLPGNPFMLESDVEGSSSCNDNGLDRRRSLLSGDMQFDISWELPSPDVLRLTLRGHADRQWFAIGFGPPIPHTMKGFDMIVVNKDGCDISSYFAEKHAARPKRTGGREGFTSAVCEVVSGLISVTVERPLELSLAQRYNINPTNQQIIFATGSNSKFGYHGPHRGGAQINFLTGDLMTEDDWAFNSLEAHGAVMVSLFAFIYPTSIFIKRVLHRQSLHQNIGKLGIGGLASALMMPVFCSDCAGNTEHANLARTTATLALCVTMLGAGIQTICLERLRWDHWLRKLVKNTHKCLGIAIVLLSPFTMWTGFRVLQPFESDALRNTPVVWCIPALLIFIVERAIQPAKDFRRRRRDALLQKSLEKWTWDQIKELENTRQFLVVHGYVIDIEAWGPNHPGGMSLLTRLSGTDATAIFDGDAPYGKGFKKRHPKSAFYRLQDWAVGTMVQSESDAESIRWSTQPQHLNSTVSVNSTLEPSSLSTLKLVSVETLPPSSDVKLFTFTSTLMVPNHGTVRFVHPVTRESRPYTSLSANIRGGELHIKFAIKIYPKGHLTQFLSKLPCGATVEITFPEDYPAWVGRQESTPRLLMLAAGTGITPMLRKLALLLEKLEWQWSQERILLVWWLSTPSSVFLADWLRFYVEKMRGRLQVWVCFTQSSSHSLIAAKPLLGGWARVHITRDARPMINKAAAHLLGTTYGQSHNKNGTAAAEGDPMDWITFDIVGDSKIDVDASAVQQMLASGVISSEVKVEERDESECVRRVLVSGPPGFSAEAMKVAAEMHDGGRGFEVLSFEDPAGGFNLSLNSDESKSNYSLNETI